MDRFSLLVVAAVMGMLATAAAAPIPEQQSAEQSATQEETVVFVVEKMNCALCSVTVRKAMSNVPGVKSVTVDFETQTATVPLSTSCLLAEP